MFTRSCKLGIKISLAVLPLLALGPVLASGMETAEGPAQSVRDGASGVASFPPEPELPTWVSTILAEEIQPGTTRVFYEPIRGTFDEAEWDDDNNRIRTGAFATVASADEGSAELSTPLFFVPDEVAPSVPAVISVTMGYNGTLAAHAAVAGSARSSITITAAVFSCTAPAGSPCVLITEKEILNSECMVKAAGLEGDECSRQVEGNGTVDFSLLLEPGRFYVVTVRAVAFARAWIAGEATANFESFDGGVYWRNARVSVERDLGFMLQSLQESVAAMQQTLSAVMNGTLQVLALDLEAERRFQEMLRQQIDEGERTTRLLERADDGWDAQTERSLLKAEPLMGLYLPSEHGGFLESVRELVGSRIAQAEAVGQDVVQARALLAAADAAMAGDNYKDALALLCTAYQSMVRGSSAQPGGLKTGTPTAP